MKDSQGVDVLEEEQENEEQDPSGTDAEEASALSKKEYEDVTDLVLLMDEHDLVEIEYEGEDHRIRLKKEGANQRRPPARPAPNGPAPAQAPSPQQNAPDAAASGGQTGAAQADPQQAPGTEQAGDVKTIKAPLVGTFYRAPSPDADPFIEEGDEVDEETVVCIIEAMKVMNEIKAEVTGTVERILVDNGEAVDFDEPLIEISPSD